MKRKELLEKRKARLEAKKADLQARANASTDAAEVRDILGKIEEVNENIKDIEDELEVLTEEARSAAPVAVGTEVPAAATIVGAAQRSFKQEAAPAEEDEDPTASVEYRKAFMAYVQRGTAMPEKFVKRAGEASTTADVGAAIPVTVMNQVINTVRKRYGNLYAKVKKTNVPGGVKYPVGALQAKFKWITEKTSSPKQEAGKLGDVTFAYNAAEIKVSVSFLVNILTLSAFEAELASVIAIAYLQAMDEAIVLGSGDGAPLGILKDARVTNEVTMTAADMTNWTKWREKFFAKLPLGYRAGEFIFPLSTVESKLETMADSNNNPIFRQATGLEVNDGDATNPGGSFFGRAISLVEPDILPDFDTASAGDVIGIFWQPDMYAMNENFGFTMRRYYDEEENEWVDKALVVVDGKILNPTGYYLIKKG